MTIETPTTIRVNFNKTIDSFKDSWGHVQMWYAIGIMNALKNHGWLRDQIPYDILGMARSVAAGKGLGF